MLLAAQIVLGASAGAAGPVVASLVGDLVDSDTRGKALGFILAGEFAGAASGLLIAGEVAAVWSWRGSFWVLAMIGPLLTVALLRGLPEPTRGAQQHIDPAERDGAAGTASRDGAAGAAGLAAGIRRSGVQPRARLVLQHDPARRPLRWVIGYVLAIPTNVVIVISSALCYFYVAGLQTFAVVYLRGKYDLSQEVATALLVVIGAGVLGGILLTGNLSDRLIARGHIRARPVVGGLCFLAAVVLFSPGLALASLLAAMPLLFLGSAALGGVNPPLDAARLDVVHYRLWGRAESIRTFCQNLIKSAAPLVFGYLSTVLAAPGESVDEVQGGGAVGLNRTFLLLLGVFVVAGLVLLLARRAYARDVATAMASEQATGAVRETAAVRDGGGHPEAEPGEGFGGGGR